MAFPPLATLSLIWPLPLQWFCLHPGLLLEDMGLSPMPGFRAWPLGFLASHTPPALLVTLLIPSVSHQWACELLLRGLPFLGSGTHCQAALTGTGGQ